MEIVLGSIAAIAFGVSLFFIWFFWDKYQHKSFWLKQYQIWLRKEIETNATLREQLKELQ